MVHIDTDTRETATDAHDITTLVLQRIRLLARRRTAWLRKLWTENAQANNGETFNAHTEVDGYLTDRDVMQQEYDWYAAEPAMKDLSHALSDTEHALFFTESRLNTLTGTFGLNRLDTDILHTCFALAVDPNLGRVFAYLHDHAGKSYITETLIAKLFGYGHCIVLAADSPLKQWGLIKETVIQPGEPARMDIDPFIRNWILGYNGTDTSLMNVASVQPAKEPLENWPVQTVAGDIRRMVNDDTQTRLRIVIEGNEGAGRRTFAAVVCSRMGLPALSINADRISENQWPQLYMLAQRQAFLSGMALLWHGTCMEERYWPTHVAAYPLQFIITESGYAPPPTGGFEDLYVQLPSISFDERLALWRTHVPLSATWPAKEVHDMVLRYDTTIGQIMSIGQKMIPTLAGTYEALRQSSCNRLGNLAQEMNSGFTFDDLVVPDHVRKGIEDFVFEATERIQFWEQPNAKRMFPQGRSLIGLFTGSPGTGKTMAAQVIAATLKLNLFRIDLSNVVSKYIGESAKNIERILSRARNMNVILLFDEADSLFGKRTDIKDAHDRYANTDTNYLLQAIESYPGIMILSSNRKSNIDGGFTRRLRYLLEFSKPDADQRAQLWRKIVTGLTNEHTTQALEADILRLAGITETTGAQIKQAIVSALFMARREQTGLQGRHLLRGIERELAKEGKGPGKQMYQKS